MKKFLKSKLPSAESITANRYLGFLSPWLAHPRLWHLHQPIYWPDKRAANDHYENAWDTIQAQNAGRSEPNEALTPVFSLAGAIGESLT